MKKTFLFLLAAVLGGYVALIDVATGAGAASDEATKGIDSRTHWTVLVPELYDDLALSGTVTQLDRTTGMVSLNTELQGNISMQFRPAALKRIKIGDVVFVNLGFSMDERTISAESCDLLAVKVASC